MIRYLVDENFDNNVVRGVVRRVPGLYRCLGSSRHREGRLDRW